MTIYVPADNRWNDFTQGFMQGLENKRKKQEEENRQKAMGDFLAMLGGQGQEQAQPAPDFSTPQPEAKQPYGYTPQFAQAFAPQMQAPQAQQSQPMSLEALLQGMAGLAGKYKGVDISQMLPVAMSVNSARQAEAERGRKQAEEQRVAEGRQKVSTVWQDAVTTGNRQAMLALYPMMKDYGIEVPAEQLKFAFPDLEWRQVDQGDKVTLVGLNPSTGQPVVTQGYTKGVSAETKYKEEKADKRNANTQANENWRASLRKQGEDAGLKRTDMDAVERWLFSGSYDPLKGLLSPGWLKTMGDKKASWDVVKKGIASRFGDNQALVDYAIKRAQGDPTSPFYSGDVTGSGKTITRAELEIMMKDTGQTEEELKKAGYVVTD